MGLCLILSTFIVFFLLPQEDVMKFKFFLISAISFCALFFWIQAVYTDSEQGEYQKLSSEKREAPSRQKVQKTLVCLESSKIYFQLDKPLYKPGETVWFQPYFCSGSELFSHPTSAIPVELINARGAVLQNYTIYPQSNSHPYFVLPATLPGGEYHLRIQGKTQEHEMRKFIVSSYITPRFKKEIKFLQESYVAGEEVRALFTVKRDTGEPFKNAEIDFKAIVDDVTLLEKTDKCNSEGMILLQFTLPKEITEGNGSLQITVKDGSFQEFHSKSIPILVQKIDFALYPEGGSFLAGVPNTVFFQAKNNIGKPAEIEGVLIDETQKEILSLTSFHRGFGKITFTPDPKKQYTIKITKPVGIKKTFPLPNYDSKGVHFTLDQNKPEGVFLTLYSTETLPNASIVSCLRGEITGFYPVSLKQGENKVFIEMPSSAQGVYRFTLFDQNQIALSERLLFRKWGKSLQIKIEKNKENYIPRESVELTVLTTDENNQPCSAQFGLAVVNDTILNYAQDKTAHLVTQLLLTSEIQGEVFEPNFYFSKEAKAEETLDYLLNTQGWRRFEWQSIPSPISYEKQMQTSFEQKEWDTCLLLFELALQEGQIKEPQTQQWIYKLYTHIAERKEIFGQPIKKLLETFEKNESYTKRKFKGAPGGIAFDELEERPRVLPQSAQVKGTGKVEKNIEALPENINNAPVQEVVKLQAEQKRQKNEAFGIAAEEDFDIAAGEAMAGRRANRDMKQIRVFPIISYEGKPAPEIRSDFRDTLYWNPRIITDSSGKTQIRFSLSDSITSFRITAEGLTSGAVAHTETEISSALPFYLQTKAPLEVTLGDRIDLPLTIHNRNNTPLQVQLKLSFGDWNHSENLNLEASSNKTLFYPIVITSSGEKILQVVASAQGLKDAFQQPIRVVERGFLMNASFSGILDENTQHFKVELPNDVILTSLSSSAKFYPSPVSTMVDGLAGMLRQPGGCFEQTTSSNYPNTMIMTYMKEYDFQDPAIWAKATEYLDSGYKRLVSFECQNGGFEWFGQGDGHEGLTAMGLMQFEDMKKVFSGVDSEMMQRTANWLKSRMDQEKGGYKQNPRFLHSWGCSKETMDAYIIYCLSEAGFSDLDRQVDYITHAANKKEDPYILALVCNSLYLHQKNLKEAEEFLSLLAQFQEKDGSFQGRTTSVVSSTGKNLHIETTALAVMAFIKAQKYQSVMESAVRWLNEQKGHHGNYGATQATVLTLKALTAYAVYSKRPVADGVVSLQINKSPQNTLKYTKDENKTLAIENLGTRLTAGENQVQLNLVSKASIPFSYSLEYRVKKPKETSQCSIGLDVQLEAPQVQMGKGVALNVKIWNKKNEGVPMTLARIGFPGGLNFQLEELKELKKKGIVDFYETRTRELIFYFTQLEANEVRSFTLNLMAEVPGFYRAEASSAYLYYTDEFEQFVEPLEITIQK